ncbi:MFS general substrate transporter [Aspergillus welwitschiae]|uniref:MFS general substrate transporter n=1 Tax=Aspergillus welwitschiae TaxID=1341132 RepID=A0A3F3Q048_9EURO|nr:MFS general substrate transporter [Aspergillus welwitschiae]RDH32455.1 MFS general substrate transporter [Aspergillus welwitschiae]
MVSKEDIETAITSTSLEAGMLDDKPNENNIIDWDGPQDPENPHNWPERKRWAHVIVVALISLVMNMAPTMCAPGINEVLSTFNIQSSTISTLAVTLYVLGLAMGPMFMSSLSEVFGRLPVYHLANLFFVAFVIGNALSQNIATFMICRFISGCAGGTPMALGGGTIADVTTIQQRAVAMSLYSLGPMAGPVLGPLIGGFVASNLTWRWTFYLLAIFSGTIGLASLLVMRETHPKIILERKAARLRKATGNPHLRSKLSNPKPVHQLLLQALTRPTKLLFRSPILLIISIYMALIFGLMYLLFTTFTDVFETQYGFTTATSGLVYLGLGVSLVTCMFIAKPLGERLTAYHFMKTGDDDTQQQHRAEYRLLPMIYFSPCVAIGLFIYGWTVYYKVHWIVPIIGTSVIGFGSFFVMMSAQLYLIDLFGSSASASALAANNVLRFICSTFLPLAGPAMYRSLGYGWGNTLLGVLALGFLPAPVVFYRYGGWMHARMGGGIDPCK